MDRQYNDNKKKISNNGSQSTTPIAKDLETQILVKNGCVFGCSGSSSSSWSTCDITCVQVSECLLF
jgi:hypothetical protein